MFVETPRAPYRPPHHHMKHPPLEDHTARAGHFKSIPVPTTVIALMLSRPVVSLAVALCVRDQQLPRRTGVADFVSPDGNITPRAIGRYTASDGLQRLVSVHQWLPRAV